MKIQLELMNGQILTFGIQLKLFEKEVRQNEKRDSHKMKFDAVIQTPELLSDIHVSQVISYLEEKQEKYFISWWSFYVSVIKSRR